MEHAELAQRLAAATDTELAVLLRRHADHLDLGLAYTLKDLCYAAWGSDPDRARGAASALAALAAVVDDPNVQALAAWTAGIAALIDGRMEQAIAHLDDAAAQWTILGQPLQAAATQVSKLMALAMLGRYDAALECGLPARDVFVEHGDLLAAGKIEQNLGNISFRRDRYIEAERFYRAARDRFLAVDDQKQLAQIENNLATTLTSQHKFQAAMPLYDQAHARAEAAGLAVTLAEIEGNIGYLAVFQGRFDRALDYLERSRRRYGALGMPHESAIAEQEIADAYLELNLAPEAVAIYTKISPLFAELGLRAEQARAVVYHARARLLLGDTAAARALLHEGHALYRAEGNTIGEALATLIEAQLHYVQGDYEAAAATAQHAVAPLAAAGTTGRLLLARWLHGEATRAAGGQVEAQRLLEAALRDAETTGVPQVAYRCATSLGLLAIAGGNVAEAERSFRYAVDLIEALRAPLPAEEFRTAFLADKLTPYAELVRLSLNHEHSASVEEALAYVERARSRALVEMLAGTMPAYVRPCDAYEAALLRQLEEQRAALNWFYSQINRPPKSEAARSAPAMAALHDAIREREAAVLVTTRQLQQRSNNPLVRVEPLDVAQLQRHLSPETALVEYWSLDGELLAFVVTDANIEVVRGLGPEAEVEAALEQLRFQLGALRHGADRLRIHLDQLATRARHHLATLYDLLLRPIEGRLETRRLVVVPYRALHYVPFQALHDGQGYVIERREVCYAPSATVLHACLAHPRGAWERAVLFGVADAQAPHVEAEVATIASLFPEARTFVDGQATVAALREHASDADLVHLACHGQFRPDSPLFSTLRLADGVLTVRDAYGLDLHAGLVTLSACETGMNAIAPGDELIGLARGFFSAGAPSLLVCLWAVDDEAAAALMTSFYRQLRAGAQPATALRSAQRTMLDQHPHPYFWAPFVLLGRW